MGVPYFRLFRKLANYMNFVLPVTVDIGPWGAKMSSAYAAWHIQVLSFVFVWQRCNACTYTFVMTCCSEGLGQKCIHTHAHIESYDVHRILGLKRYEEVGALSHVKIKFFNAGFFSSSKKKLFFKLSKQVFQNVIEFQCLNLLRTQASPGHRYWPCGTCEKMSMHQCYKKYDTCNDGIKY